MRVGSGSFLRQRSDEAWTDPADGLRAAISAPVEVRFFERFQMHILVRNVSDHPIRATFPRMDGHPDHRAGRGYVHRGVTLPPRPEQEDDDRRDGELCNLAEPPTSREASPLPIGVIWFCRRTLERCPICSSSFRNTRSQLPSHGTASGSHSAWLGRSSKV